MKYDNHRIPRSWKYCFNNSCPMRQECLRFQTGLELPDGRLWGNAIFPTALKDGQCPFFRSSEKVLLATGFVVPGNPHMSNLFAALRQSIGDLLGHGGTYYLYRNGKRWLTPAKQEAIRQLFRDNGYTDEVQFAQYKEDYDFSL